MALIMPIKSTIKSSLPIVSLNQFANEGSMCECSNVATASKMPIKNTIDAMSMRFNALVKLR